MRREIVRLRPPVDREPPRGLVASSPAMQRVLTLASRAARGDATVLLTGESGTGKGVVARLVHDRSARAAGPFVQVNCAAMPATLAESELFGVRRGAYTDARESRPGLFAEANGGTLFLDEIGEMPLEIQPKLLQAIETRRVRPVGGSQERPVDVRIVAATNQGLDAALREGRFRTDLYYRLNVIPLDIPPLRERREDIEPLANRFLERAAGRPGGTPAGLSAPALRWLLANDWPGNVRELWNCIERAVALCDHDVLTLADLAPRVAAELAGGDETLEQAIARGAPLAEVVRLYIAREVDRQGGNKANAARALGIDRRTLYRRLSRSSGQPNHSDADISSPDAPSASASASASGKALRGGAASSADIPTGISADHSVAK